MGASKIAHSARQIEGQTSFCNASVGAASMDLGISRGALQCLHGCTPRRAKVEPLAIDIAIAISIVVAMVGFPSI
jgi:hypothetical protein